MLNVKLIDIQVGKNIRAESIYMDGKYKGRLPFRERLSYSPFKVEVKPDDHRYRSYYERISPAKRGGTVDREIALKGIYGRVAVDSKPFLQGGNSKAVAGGYGE